MDQSIQHYAWDSNYCFSCHCYLRLLLIFFSTKVTLINTAIILMKIIFSELFLFIIFLCFKVMKCMLPPLWVLCFLSQNAKFFTLQFELSEFGLKDQFGLWKKLFSYQLKSLYQERVLWQPGNFFFFKILGMIMKKFGAPFYISSKKNLMSFVIFTLSNLQSDVCMIQFCLFHKISKSFSLCFLFR